MRLPNKVTSYSKSIVALFPSILNVLEAKDTTPQELLKVTRNSSKLSDYMSALDCLFAMGKIELIEEERVLHYVDQTLVRQIQK